MALLTFDIPLDKIMTDPNNARKHDSKNLDAIKGSLQKFGQQKPIVVDEKNIVLAGNGTLAAARALGWKTITVVRTALTGYDAMAYALADNRTSELAEWDDDVLGAQLQALREFDYPIQGFGFEPLVADDDDDDDELVKNTSKELDLLDFEKFDHDCPKCGFSFNDENKK